MRKKRVIAGIVTSALLSTVLIKNIAFAEYTVDGVSMQPTLKEGHHFYINKLTNRFNKIERFDIVVFHMPGEKQALVKRVIGLPGEKIEYRDDKLYVNGKYVPEPFLKKNKEKVYGNPITGNFTLKEITGKETVPEKCIFVIGDNRLNSRDSRHFGFVHEKNVIGEVKP